MRKRCCTVEVNKRVKEVPNGAFRGLARECKEVKLEEQELPAWAKKTVVKILKQVSEDHEVRNDFLKKCGRTWTS